MKTLELIFFNNYFPHTNMVSILKYFFKLKHIIMKKTANNSLQQAELMLFELY